MRCGFPRLAVLSARLALGVLVLLVGACGPGVYRWDAGSADPAKDRIYEVRRGDTLYSIAWRYGLDYRALARRNDIGPEYIIYPGQRLALVPGAEPRQSTARTSAAPSREVSPPLPSRPMPRGAWRWPASGQVLATFGSDEALGKGITIGGSIGDPILASADGKVVYAGSGLIGYGKIIIVKHSEAYLSAYGHNDTILVREGEQVKQGDRIATMGRGPGNQPLLHFEIRLDGEAVDPLAYLPPR